MVSSEDPVTMWGDSTQLHQVLLNLSVNARDAMPGGGVLTIGVGSVEIDAELAATQHDAVMGRYVVLTVGDTGSGIPVALRERIFDPFFTTKAPGSGTGLGLATTLSIVRGHGGFITMESQEGVGTTFRVFIPAGADEPLAPAEPPAATVIPHGEGELILLVDDEEPILNLMRQTLEEFGYRVLTCSNGSEAEQAFLWHADDIAAVITDMVMPVMDGPRLIAVMKEIRPAIRVIAISGMTTDASIDIITRHGVQGVISKPFTVATILQTLRQVLGETAVPAITPSA
jgi:CheY-like chemotaxis protein